MVNRGSSGGPARSSSEATRPKPPVRHGTSGNRDLVAWVAERRAEVEALLSARFPARERPHDPGRLIEAIRYSLLAPGKRVRPLLALAAAEAAGGVLDKSTCVAAAAVELIHCYSLIHDDLPAMDDDDFRRGKPSNHKVFGEAIAILAGDALLTAAFEWLAEAGELSGRPAAFGRAALALARAAGAAGMVRGQARDVGEPAPSTLDALEELHGEKTAALFRASLEVGAAAAGATPAAIEAFGRFGTCYGIAFQHADDLDDREHPELASAARRRLAGCLTEATAALDALPTSGDTWVLRELAGELARKG